MRFRRRTIFHGSGNVRHRISSLPEQDGKYRDTCQLCVFAGGRQAVIQFRLGLKFIRRFQAVFRQIALSGVKRRITTGVIHSSAQGILIRKLIFTVCQ